MEKRKQMYVLKPYVYEITCDKCNGHNIEWSEYDGMIWCYDCQIDTKGNGGIFSGPIPVEATKLLLGHHCFDMIDLETNKYLVFTQTQDGKIEYVEKDMQV